MRQLSLGSRETAEILPAVSQLEEMGAYEHLWLNYPGEKAATTKKIIDLFASKPGSIPSDFVDSIDSAACAKKVFSAIGSDGISEIGIRIRGISDYPDWLEGVRHQLPLLYFKGFWDLIWKPKRIAIVGTRSPSEAGIRRTRRLAELLIKSDFTIVSGLAKGIDTVAHETAVSLGSVADSSSRPLIYEGFNRHRTELLVHGVADEAPCLLDGSFTTNKLDPQDLDLVVEVDEVAFLGSQRLQQLLGGPSAKDEFCCDAYPLVVYDANHPSFASVTEAGREYWTKWFGTDRLGNPKGRVWTNTGRFR